MNRLIADYQLFLFDFDGLLVDTEPLHYSAYVELCHRHGYELNWNLEQYCRAAHFKSFGMRDALSQEFPGLISQDSSWEQLYAEKKQIYMRLLSEGRVKLMPGAEKLLSLLQARHLKHAVVTNSPKEQIETIKRSFAVLQKIPLWLTREDYTAPKPAPDGYLKAIKQLADEGDRVIGFEDSLKGLQSLCAAQAKAVLVCPKDHPQLEECRALEMIHVESLESVLDFD